MKKTIILIISVLILFASCNPATPIKELPKHKVTLKWNDGTVDEVKYVESGSVFTLPQDHKVNNAVLIGWQDSKGLIEDNSIEIYSDVTFNALWYSFSGDIMIDGAVILNSAVIQSGSNITISYSAVNSPYVRWAWKINGQSIGENALSFNRTFTSEDEYLITLECNGKEATRLNLSVTSKPVYKISYHVQDAIIVDYGYEENDRVLLLNNDDIEMLIDEGLMLSSWLVASPNSVVIDDEIITMPASDVILNANLIDKEYSIELEVEEGLVVEQIKKSKAGILINLPEVTGYDSSIYKPVWILDGERLNSSSFVMPNHDVNLKVIKERKSYTVTVDYDDNVVLSELYILTQAPNTVVKLPTVISKPEGYDVIWYEVTMDGDKPLNVKNNTFIMPDHDIIIKLSLSVAEYWIIQELGNWKCDTSIPTSAFVGKEVMLPPSAEQPGYTFVKWSVCDATSGKEVEMLDSRTFIMPKYDVKIKAVGNANEHNLYVKYFDDNGEISKFGDDGRFRYSPAGPYTVKYGSLVEFTKKDGEYYAITHIRSCNYEFPLRSYYFNEEGKKVDIDIAGMDFIMPDYDVVVELKYESFSEELLKGKIIHIFDEDGTYRFYDSAGYLINYDMKNRDPDKLADVYSYTRYYGRDCFLVVAEKPLSGGSRLHWGFHRNSSFVGAAASPPEDGEELIFCKLDLGAGVENTRKILSYINSFASNETPSDQRVATGYINNKKNPNNLNLYRNCDVINRLGVNKYLWDELVSFRKITKINDWFIPSVKEAEIIAAYYKTHEVPEAIKDIVLKSFWTSSCYGYPFTQAFMYTYDVGATNYGREQTLPAIAVRMI